MLNSPKRKLNQFQKGNSVSPFSSLVHIPPQAALKSDSLRKIQKLDHHGFNLHPHSSSYIPLHKSP